MADVTARPLDIMLEMLWGLGEVPEDWKKANVKPIFKQGRKEDAGSCQPISHDTPVDKRSKYGLEKWKMRWMEKCLNPRGLCPPLIGVLEDGTRGIVSRFVDDTELGGVAGTAAGCTAAQKDVGRLEKWAERKLIKFNKGKDKVLPLGRHNGMDQYWGLGADCLESRFLEKDQGVVVANKLATSQQCGCVAKQADSLLGCVQERFASRWREVILPL
ncbi:hypothetical protein QYF61_021358 [Mycteria americana]|uniref:Rna-directed dna polymerase from mobile element jockey-like n=1 Tax=Mycteria americana TaxID=33587 RepID=A0AAN7RJG9_MYCAM|nr:hypothetical protein QYF61_021358 [Mycteria americana]